MGKSDNESVMKGYTFGVLTGALILFALGFGLRSNTFAPSKLENITTEDSTRSVLLGKRIGRDLIYVSEDNQNYVHLGEYIDSFENALDRDLERAKIMKEVYGEQ